MGRREKALPDVMPPAHRQFIEALRKVRGEAGYTLAKLSSLTPYSPAAVARALSGQAFPSAELAEALIVVLGEDGVSKRLLLDRLWKEAKEENAHLLEEASRPIVAKQAETDLRAALDKLYRKAGSPPLRDLQNAGGPSRSTLHRVLQDPTAVPAHTVLLTADALSRYLPDSHRTRYMEEVTRELVEAAKTDKVTGEFDTAELKRYILEADPTARKEEVVNALPGMEQENRLFISYAHKDNELFDEAVAIFAKDVSNFYSAKTGNTLNYFFDRQSIGWGENWRAEIDRGLDNSMVFMPIITMQYFNRAACRDELNAFKSSADRLGVKELILPVVIAGARSIKADHEIPEVRIIESLQYRDLESAFLSGPGTPEWRTALSVLTDELIGVIDRVEAEQEARRSSGQPILPSDAATEGEESDLLQGMSDLSTISERVEEEIAEATQAVEAWVEAISGDMESFANQKTPQQMQAVSLRMASKAKMPSIRLRDAGTALATTTAEADALLRFMIEQLSQTGSSDAREMAKQLTESMQEDSPDLQSLLSQMSGVLSMLTVFEVMSSPLRASLKPARVGINKLQDAFRIVDSWSSLPKIS
ncbi:hypothetical protein GCM10010264_33180 [Streptomyces globisporus]|uniref:TIR domain-containing protein n=1 Tax=Streptomyces globisporus TaxID=1908 RepID=UPI00177E1ABE|nr:hypothetical protein GCM10010264_33180 [Streptomyces globisporus]